MKKIIMFLLLAISTLSLNNSCSSTDSEIKREVEKLNKTCPISLGACGDVTSITYDNKTITYNILAEDIYINTQYANKYPDKIKDNIIITMVQSGNTDIKDLSNLCHNKKISIEYKYTKRTSREILSLVLSPDEFYEKYQKFEKYSSYEIDRYSLDIQIEAMKMSLPIVLGEGMTFTETFADEHNFFYLYKTDQNIFNNISQNTLATKQNIVSNLNPNDLALANFMRLLIRLKMNLIYRYTTDHDTCDIIIYNDELSKIF